MSQIRSSRAMSLILIGLACFAIGAWSVALSPSRAAYRPAPTPHVNVRVTLTAERTPAYTYRIPRWHAYLAALSQGGCWYVWAGAGPCNRGYDCSGLVVWAYAQVGISLPHNTVQMLYSGKLTQVSVSQLKPGDLAFFGTGHVELYTGWWRWTFGALEPGTRLAMHYWWPGSWAPTAFYHVNGSG